jgi:hypothetical protein
MQTSYPKATASLSEALADVRNALFVVADDAVQLSFPMGDLVDFLLVANYNLGEAERKLAAA